MKENSANADAVIKLATRSDNLGILLGYSGKLSEARAAHESAIAILFELVKQEQASPGGDFALASSRLNLGSFLGERGLPDAEPQIDDAWPLLERLSDEHPSNTRYHSTLAGVYLHLSQFIAKRIKPLRLSARVVADRGSGPP